MALDPEPKSTRMGESGIRLILNAARSRSLEEARRDVDSIGKGSLETGHVLLTFLDEHSEVAEEFAERLGATVQALRDALAEAHPSEPQPEPRRLPENPTEEQRKMFDLMKPMEDERRAKGEAEPFSGPLKRAQRAAKQTAVARGDARIQVGTLLVALIEGDGHAGEVVHAIADPERLRAALEWLGDKPDPAERGRIFDMAEIEANMRKTLNAAWPSIRAKGEERRGEDAKRRWDEAYEKDPARYEEPVDIAQELAKASPMPESDFLWRVSICRRAAENEARRRKAPEITLDHLLIALLRDGTDTARFLDRRGVDRAAWSRRLDAELRRYAEGPRWPPADRAFGMSQPDNKRVKVKRTPEGVEFGDLPTEEARKYVDIGYDEAKRFTDLAYTTKMLSEPSAVAFRLFTEAGITKDDLKAETFARERDDEEWWKRPPDILKDLAEVREDGLGNPLMMAFECQKAAAYEARMRGAKSVELDDLLMAILVPGTDTWKLLQELGQDPAAIREEVDLGRPHGPVGPLFPSTDDLPAGLPALAKKGFSDLLFVRPSRKQGNDESLGLRLLRERGLTLQVINDRLAQLGVVPF